MKLQDSLTPLSLLGPISTYFNGLQGIEAALQDPMMRVAQTQLRLEGLKTQRADPFLHSPASPVTTHDCHIITYIKEKKTGKNKVYVFLLKVLINLL
jgi:hypothetical protein